jgi:hypothetical protein
VIDGLGKFIVVCIIDLVFGDFGDDDDKYDFNVRFFEDFVGVGKYKISAFFE